MRIVIVPAGMNLAEVPATKALSVKETFPRAMPDNITRWEQVKTHLGNNSSNMDLRRREALARQCSSNTLV